MKNWPIAISLVGLAGILLGCQPVEVSIFPTDTAGPLETQILVIPATGPVLTPFLPEISTPSPDPARPAALDPRVDIDVVNNTYHLGDLIFIAGFPRGVAMPIYALVVRDEGVQDSQAMVEVTSDNQVTTYPGKSRVLEFVSAEASADQVTFVLRAKAPGTATVTIEATGIIHAEDQSNGMELMASGDVMIVVEK